jgi:hypothetical protein
MNRKQRRASNKSPNVHVRVFSENDDVGPAMVDAIRANAVALETISDGDREWFLANPGRAYRLRPISEAERASYPGKPPDVGVCTYIIVRQIRPGIRMRVYFDAYPFHRPENFSDDACAMLFDEIKTKRAEVSETIRTLSEIGERS